MDIIIKNVEEKGLEAFPQLYEYLNKTSYAEILYAKGQNIVETNVLQTLIEKNLLPEASNYFGRKCVNGYEGDSHDCLMELIQKSLTDSNAYLAVLTTLSQNDDVEADHLRLAATINIRIFKFMIKIIAKNIVKESLCLIRNGSEEICIDAYDVNMLKDISKLQNDIKYSSKTYGQVLEGFAQLAGALGALEPDNIYSRDLEEEVSYERKFSGEIRTDNDENSSYMSNSEASDSGGESDSESNGDCDGDSHFQNSDGDNEEQVLNDKLASTRTTNEIGRANVNLSANGNVTKGYDHENTNKMSEQNDTDDDNESTFPPMARSLDDESETTASIDTIPGIDDESPNEDTGTESDTQNQTRQILSAEMGVNNEKSDGKDNLKPTWKIIPTFSKAIPRLPWFRKGRKDTNSDQSDVSIQDVNTKPSQAIHESQSANVGEQVETVPKMKIETHSSETTKVAENRETNQFSIKHSDKAKEALQHLFGEVNSNADNEARHLECKTTEVASGVIDDDDL